MAPGGRAFLKGAEYSPAHEEPTDEYPLLYTTGRTAYQFHTRTKTGRARSLNRAAPQAWVELSLDDARQLGVAEGDVVRVESPRGSIEVPARVGEVRPGAVFAPFHYGSWQPEGGATAGPGPGQANELTMTVWDPVSKQPYFKTAACRVTRLRDGSGPSPAPTTTASRPAPDAGTTGRPSVPPTQGGDATSSTVVHDAPRFPLDPAQDGDR